jgi:hypothetical protein
MMTTPETPSGKPYDGLLFSIAYAISRSSIIPKSYRKMDIAEPLAREIIDHLARCNYQFNKGPETQPHGPTLPDKPGE